MADQFPTKQNFYDAEKDLRTMSAVSNSRDPDTGAAIDSWVTRRGDTTDTLNGRLDKIGPIVVGDTATGAILSSANESVLNNTVGSAGFGNYYAWAGSFPKTVAPGTDPALPASGYVVRSDVALRAQITSNGGAAIIGSETGLTVQQQIGDMIIVRPVGNPAGDKAALLAAEAAAAATGMSVHTLKGDVFTIDNSAGTGITFTQDDFELTGLGKIKATHDTNTLALTTGDRARVHKGVKFEGPGTHRPDLGAAGDPPALLKMTGDDSHAEGCWFIEPYTAALFIKEAAGGMDKKNTISCSYAGTIAQPFLFGIYYRTISDRIAMGNVIDGCIQGICGGGDGSGLLTVTSKDGIVTSSVRNVTVTMNTCVNQLDHCIYFSNNTSDISILENKGLKSVNDLIKIEGGPNQVVGNTGKGGSAITGRNVFDTTIDRNIITTTLSSANAYGILLYEQQFKRPIETVTISNNQLTHEGVTSKAGIYVIGDVWDGYQSVISSLTINDNKLKGYGNVSEGSQIGVIQKVFPGSPVTGSLASVVVIQDNECEFPAHSVPTYGIELSFGLSGGNVSGNILKGFRSQGVRSLGVQGFNFTGNTLQPDPSVAVTGFFERAKDTSLHANSQNNKYSDNVYIGNFAREVTHSDETCYNTDRKVLRVTSNSPTYSVIASTWPKQVVYNNHPAGAVVTLDALTSSPWPIDSDLTITNAGGANSLTVNPGGHVVAAGTSLRLVGIGSNTWIKAN